MFPSIYGNQTDNTGIHTDIDRVGHHLSAVPCSYGAVGKDNQPVNDIAHRLLLETNTVTPLLQRMEKQGIVCRKKGEKDKRQQIVSLTEKGKELEKKAYAKIPSGMGDQLSACPLKLEDYKRLAQELDSIIETLKK